MKIEQRRYRAWLLATAKAVAKNLKSQSSGTQLRIRIPRRATSTNTDGWSVVIGNLGKNQPRLEIWLDRFSGYPERKLWACFSSKTRPQIAAITKRVSRKLWPVRTITQDDLQDGHIVALEGRLERSQFNAPIVEKYSGGLTFYGVYDPTRTTIERLNSHFRSRATAFFEDVARALPHATPDDEQRDVYPQYENRKLVTSHLHRERSRLLATECKIRDKYRCRICTFDFEKIYGKLGREFAEAHHLVPLGKLRGQVRTSVEDLATVCANCHRMLHRMAGQPKDIETLKIKMKRR